MSHFYTQPEPKPGLKEQPANTSERTLLDSVFSKNGPMPPTNIGLRALAFILDFILITAVGSVIIWKITLPQSHPAAFSELAQWSESLIDWYADKENRPEATLPDPSKSLRRALAVANEIQLLSFWIYFAIGEAFFAGSSLGKRICRIRSVSTVNLSFPPIMAGVVRGGLKTLTIYLFFPLGLLATLATLFFNKRSQMGHDLMSRTVVIDEKYLDLTKTK